MEGQGEMGNSLLSITVQCLCKGKGEGRLDLSGFFAVNQPREPVQKAVMIGSVAILYHPFNNLFLSFHLAEAATGFQHPTQVKFGLS